VSKLAWPGEPLDEQRQRLVDALAELAGRCGVHPHVVFDGIDGGGGPARPPSRSVQVTFSPAGVAADDVLLALVDEHPLGKPVVVASSDREVRAGGRARGANTISSAQLLAVLGRYGLPT
jgi:predicted RNA-binding protein with PIN domain